MLVRMSHPLVCLVVAFTAGLLPALGLFTLHVCVKPTRQLYRSM